MEALRQFLAALQAVLDIPLFYIGVTQITVATLLTVGLLVLALFYVTAWLQRLLVRGLQARGNMEVGTREALGVREWPRPVRSAP
jgi:small-conductance mechanosensitive channel